MLKQNIVMVKQDATFQDQCFNFYQKNSIRYFKGKSQGKLSYIILNDFIQFDDAKNVLVRKFCNPIFLTTQNLSIFKEKKVSCQVFTLLCVLKKTF